MLHQWAKSNKYDENKRELTAVNSIKALQSEFFMKNHSKARFANSTDSSSYIPASGIVNLLEIIAIIFQAPLRNL